MAIDFICGQDGSQSFLDYYDVHQCFTLLYCIV